MRALRSYQSTMRWSVVTALLLSVLALCQASETHSSTRSLRQNGDRQTRITEENVGNLPRLVNETRNAMVFVFATDVDLPSIITVRRRRLTFRGAEGRRPTIRCASGEGGFVVRANQTAFENLIIRDCNQTAILVADEVEEYNPFESDDPPDEAERLDVTIREVDFIGNAASDDDIPAGAFVAMEKVHAELIGCHFERNVRVTGGAIAFSGDSLLVDECTFERNNAANSGGAIQARREVEDAVERSNSSVTVSKCTFTENRSSNGGKDRIGLTLTGSVDLEPNRYVDFPLPAPSGGAVYVSGFERVNFQSSNFTANSAVPAGGAIYLRDSKGVEVSGCRFDRNFVLPPRTDADSRDLQQGGALFIAFEGESELVIQRCNFTENNAVYGGALHFVGQTNAPFQMLKCTFRNNVATLGGGAVLFRNVDAPRVEETHFIQNSAFLGGAVLLTNGAGLDMVQTNVGGPPSSFIDNVAHDGGGIFGIGGGTLKVFRVVFDGNLAESRGGAVCYVDSKASGRLFMQDARMSRNRAETGGAIFLDNVAEVMSVPGERSLVSLVSLVSHDETRSRSDWFNLFRQNVAVAGGAIYYKASNSVRNRFHVQDARFVKNRVHSKLSLVHEEPLNYPGLQRTRGYLPVDDEESAPNVTDGSDRTLIDPTSPQPCHPGGGGAVCVVLSDLADPTPVDFRVIHTNFTKNHAVVGGALLIATETDIDWKSRCAAGGDATRAALTTNPCGSLILRDVRFERNRAEAAGGAIFATNLSHVFYSTAAIEYISPDFRRLRQVVVDERFTGNSVGESGYGANIAGLAVRLRIDRPLPKPRTGVVLVSLSSGKSVPEDRIVVEALDGLNQVVSDGILDSSLSVDAESYRRNNRSRNSKPLVGSMTAVQGVLEFQISALTAEPGVYTVSFASHDRRVAGTEVTLQVGECSLGDRYIREAQQCEKCQINTFTFYNETAACLICPVHARCEGGASLVPDMGYWHSGPFSIAMHKCFRDDACSYSGRENNLKKDRSDNLNAFLARFQKAEHPLFSNEEYRQCSPGYGGLLCGSCQSGYGQVNGKSCAECRGRRITATIIFVIGLWQLAFLAVTIRSALVSIRDMNQMMAVQRQQTLVSVHSTRHRFRRGYSSRSVSGIVQAAAERPGSLQLAAIGEAHLFQSIEGDEAESSSSQQSPAHQSTVECIIAAQHMSETIKIFVNFFQVTSVAVNINMDWTESLKKLLTTMGSVVGFSNGSTYAPMTCLFTEDAENRSVYGVVLRVAFPVCLLTVVLVAFWMQWISQRQTIDTLAERPPLLHRSRIIVASLIVGFFAYQSVSEDLMGTVSCIQLDAKEMKDIARHNDLKYGIDYTKFSIARDRYWTEDTSVKCYSGSHALLVGLLGVPGIVIYLCGLPLFLLVFLLHKRRQGQLMTMKVMNTYGFLYQNYEEQFVYWEVCIIIRKALISASVVFAYPLGSNLQGIFALGVLFTALTLQQAAAPFRYRTLNALECLSIIVSICTFYCGLAFNDENTSEGGKVLLSILLVGMNSALTIVFVVAMYVYADRFATAKLKSMEDGEVPKRSLGRMALLVYRLFSQNASDLSARIRKIMTSRTPSSGHSIALDSSGQATQSSATP